MNTQTQIHSIINKEQLIEIINKAHNPNLVDNTAKMAPNENLIYHLYTDGEITEQKGSWAYLQRSERTIKYPYQYQSHVYIDKRAFPLYRDTGFGYIICTESDAYRIRKLLKEYYNSIN